jgi:resuscitation-promoting factor RpfB
MLRWRPYVLAFSLFVSFQPQIISQSQPTGTPVTDTKPKQGKPNCTNNGTYANSRGQTVPRPENCSDAPKGATAQCRDGSYSFSQSRRGTCSHHGGVTKWL